MDKNYIFLADGFEEIEALAVADILRRAGMPVSLVSINDTTEVTGAHGITVQADTLYTYGSYNDADFLILPGGMPGATNLHEHDALNSLLKSHFADGGHVAAICASPAVVLAPAGILDGRRATCYPGFEEAAKAYGARMEDKAVVQDGNLVTANGPASAIKFGLAIVAMALGDAAAAQVAAGMLVK